jgi:hypothetical protein
MIFFNDLKSCILDSGFDPPQKKACVADRYRWNADFLVKHPHFLHRGSLFKQNSYQTYNPV